MKKTILLIAIIFLSITSVVAQDIHFTFANAQTTNDGVDDFFEVDVMIQTINSTGTFKLGSGQLYFNYNTAAFGENVVTNGRFEVTHPNPDYICGQYVDAAAANIYGSYTPNDNTTSRVSWSFSQTFSSSTFAADNVLEAPTRLFHLKLKFIDNNETPNVTYEDGGVFDDQFFTACGLVSGGPFGTADCTTEPGVQLVNDTFDSSGATLSVSEVGIIGEYKLYPNPTEGLINIDGNVSELSNIDVYSMIGQKLMTVNSNFEQLDISSLSSGVVFVKLNSKTGSKTFKVVKE